MRENKTIQNFIALVLLLVFSISAMPQSFFHDLLAGHKDSPACHEPTSTETHLHQRTFECHFDNLVVNVPYFGTEPQLTEAVTNFFTAHLAGLVQDQLVHRATSFDSRGPPSA